jgi:hypothetical protein
MQNDIEKAIEAIKNNFPPENYTMLREGLTLAIEIMQEKQERQWIPVTERLPDRGERVLFCDNIFVAEGYLDITGAWHRYDGIIVDLFDIKVTHWMSLPDPPEVTK